MIGTWLRRLRDAALVLTLALGLVAVAEVAVRLLAPQTLRHEYAETGSLGIPDPVLGHVYRPSTRSRVRGPEFDVDYVINADGLRDETHHAMPKPEGERRVLVLGDSFAFGAGNDYDDIWPVLVERDLRARGLDLGVVKAGVSAYDTRTEALYLERLFPRYDPDLVLVTFLPNDLFTNRPFEAGTAPEPERELTVAAGGTSATSHLAILAKRLLMKRDALYVAAYLRSGRGFFFRDPPPADLVARLETTGVLMERLCAYARERGAAVAFLSVPQQFQVLAEDDALGDDVDIHLLDDRLSAIADGLGADWIPALGPLRRAYREGETPLYHRLDGHLTAAGNRVVADVVADYLTGRLDSVK